MVGHPGMYIPPWHRRTGRVLGGGGAAGVGHDGPLCLDVERRRGRRLRPHRGGLRQHGRRDVVGRSAGHRAGLDYAQARRYNPRIGRFTRIDPVYSVYSSRSGGTGMPMR